MACDLWWQKDTMRIKIVIKMLVRASCLCGHGIGMINIWWVNGKGDTAYVQTWMKPSFTETLWNASLWGADWICKPLDLQYSWLSRSLDSVRRVPSGKMVNVYGMALVMFNKAKKMRQHGICRKISTSCRGFLEKTGLLPSAKRMGPLKSNWQSQRTSSRRSQAQRL